MKFKSSVYTQVSGSVGGLTYSHNAGGMYARARAVPTDPASEYQVRMRNAVAVLAARWRDVLTAGQRDAWNDYAANTPILDTLGDPRLVSGIAMYIRGNTPRIQFSEILSLGTLDIVDDGPTEFGIPSFTPVTVEVTETPQNIELSFTAADPWVNLNGNRLYLWASRPLSPAINFFKGPYRPVSAVIGLNAGPPTSPVNFSPPFPVAEGQQVGIAVRLDREDARLSYEQTLLVTVAATP